MWPYFSCVLGDRLNRHRQFTLIMYRLSAVALLARIRALVIAEFAVRYAAWSRFVLISMQPNLDWCCFAGTCTFPFSHSLQPAPRFIYWFVLDSVSSIWVESPHRVLDAHEEDCRNILLQSALINNSILMHIS